jgi:hypothetical protein
VRRLPWQYRRRCTTRPRVRTALHAPQTLDEWAREHLFYELQQAVGTTVLTVAPGAWLAATKPILLYGSNAHFESHLVHLRNLDDFFRFDHEPSKAGEPQHPRDVLAVDYLPTWVPRALLTKSQCGEVNARLQHVSIDREAGVAKPWDLAASTRVVLDLARAFMGEVEAPGATPRTTDPGLIRRAVENAEQVLADHGIDVSRSGHVATTTTSGTTTSVSTVSRTDSSEAP